MLTCRRLALTVALIFSAIVVANPSAQVPRSDDQVWSGFLEYLK
jgi:hypothetical protein